ncbi:jerky protein homolog [Echinops telfairi]|uniref:Jerky protein homolog n=1 Tax=Echinops telfairi TaxID=9371 RepID=A0ABM0IDP8_ECHTE|nr:jerky protein homolog [Echinops telfairi]
MASQAVAKRKRVVLTLKEKMDICARLEKGENRKALMQEYNVGMSTLYDIKAHKAQLLRFFAGSDSQQALERRRTLHTPKLGHLDRVLYEWFLVKRAEGVPVSGPMLIEKAKGFYEQMRLTEPCVFSGGWLWRFKARHGIKKLDAACEKQAVNRQAAEQFCGFFQGLVAEHGLSPEQLYDAEETGLLWHCLSHPAPEGHPAPGLQQGRDRLTVLLCANAAGSHKVKPLVVGKCRGPRALQGLQHLPVAYRAQGHHGWVDKEIFADWFHHVFVPSVHEHFRTVGLPSDGKAILLLDNSQAHPPEAALVSDNIFTIFLPAGVASLIQPMHQGVRRAFLRSFLSPPAPLQDFHPRYSIHDAVLTVACAWGAVPSVLLRRAWRKLWPAAVFADGCSEEDNDEVAGRPQSKALAHIPEAIPEPLKDSPAPVGGAGPKCEGGEWAGVAPQRALALRGGGHRAGLALGREAPGAWEKAAACFKGILDFAERHPCFSPRELGQLRLLHSAFLRHRLALGSVVKTEGPHECPGAGLAPVRPPLPCTSAAAHSDS